ncbi:hypothetical protein [Streptomyces sp. NPDC048637]|uniref:hypothetical protein n=1 Tax=Streptomyces sp. NPDC048637 TaxID=3155636 RepID=UPI0034323121
MRFVTYASADGDRAGILNGQLIHALPEGSSLLELLGPALRLAGEHALSEPAEVIALADVTLSATPANQDRHDHHRATPRRAS